MINQLRSAFTLFGLLTLLTGILYPLAVTGIAQAVFPFQANGSLIENNTMIIGSQLIGQDFTRPQYFWGRPSATPGSPYNAFDPVALTGSSGSNLGPLSRTLFESVQSRVESLQAADPGNNLQIPVDLVTSSASGLDPHISIEAAYFQVPRVARARGLSEPEVFTLVNRYTEGRQFGFLGEPRVNVLLLNIALDGIQ
ncbi:MAG: potassium-transporting ATPase subunit KdpC [Anaerolineaceae bacterium]